MTTSDARKRIRENAAQAATTPAPVAVPEGVTRALWAEIKRLTEIIGSASSFMDAFHAERIQYAEHDRKAIREHLASLHAPREDAPRSEPQARECIRVGIDGDGDDGLDMCATHYAQWDECKLRAPRPEPVTAPLPSEAVRAASRAFYIADSQDPEWAARAWDNMGGSEPSAERADLEISMQAALVAALPALAAAWRSADQRARDEDGLLIAVCDVIERALTTNEHADSPLAADSLASGLAVDVVRLVARDEGKVREKIALEIEATTTFAPEGTNEPNRLYRTGWGAAMKRAARIARGGTR